MMNNTTDIFIQPGLQIKFLTVCHYITSIGHIFFNEQLIKFDEQNQHIVVLNKLFEYLDKSHNETQAKQLLLQKILRGTDLYGGGENDTLDQEYINETYQYIAITSLFSHYGGIYGYLAGIINRSRNLTRANLRKEIFVDLFNNYNSTDYCSERKRIFKLTPLSITKVMKNYIMPLFPIPKTQNMSLLDAEYIYAMAGLKIAQALEANDEDLGFEYYIMLSHTAEIMTSEDTNPLHALLAFSAPALFYCAFTEKEKFRKLDLTKLDQIFWIEAYQMLFIYLNSAVQTAAQEALVTSIYSTLDSEMKKIRNRTALAEYYLTKYCPFNKPSDSLISFYKTSYPLFYLSNWVFKQKFLLSCDLNKLPNVNDEFEKQFETIKEIYSLLEMNRIHEALAKGNIVDKINATSTYVSTADVKYEPIYCVKNTGNCFPLKQKPSDDTYLLFVIKQNGTEEFYALKPDFFSELMLLEHRGNEGEFKKALELTADTEFIAAGELKNKKENYLDFIKKIADPKAEKYIKHLSADYYEETMGEKVIEFFKSLIPFYSCFQLFTDKSNPNLDGLMCNLDIIFMFPLLKTTFKLGAELIKSIAYNAKTVLMATKAALMAGFNGPGRSFTQLLASTGRTLISRHLLKQAFKKFFISVLHVLDPGIEFVYSVGRLGWHYGKRLFKTVMTNLKQLPVKQLHTRINRFISKVFSRKAKSPEYIRLISREEATTQGRTFFRHSYPGRQSFFGPLCVKLFGKIAEIRRVAGRWTRIFAVRVGMVEDTVRYRALNPNSGELSDFELTLDDNDMLQFTQYSDEGSELEISEDEHNFSDFEADDYDDPREYKLSVDEPSKVEKLSDEDITRELASENKDFKEPSEIKNAEEESKAARDRDLLSQGTSKDAKLEEYLQRKKNAQDLEMQQEHDFVYTAEDAARKIATITGLNERDILEQLRPLALYTGKFHKNFPTYYHLAHHMELYKDLNKGSLHNLLEVDNAIHSFKTKLLSETNIDWEKNMILTKYGKSCEKQFDLTIDSARLKYISCTDEEMSFSDFYSLMLYRKHGIFSLKFNSEGRRHLKMLLHRLSIRHINFKLANNMIDEPVKLWISELKYKTISDRFLKSLEGETFSFNDFILAKRMSHISTEPRLLTGPSLYNGVSYMIEVSPYRTIDLTHIHPDFGNEYIIFPDVKFHVQKVKLSQEQNRLTLDMKEQFLSQEKVKIDRIFELDSLMPKKEYTIRSEAVQKAAQIIYSKIPFQARGMPERLLNKYLLEFSPNIQYLPTYEELAENFCRDLQIPPWFHEYKIHKFESFGHLLFGEKSLDKISDLTEAKKLINELYPSFELGNIDEVFNNYKRTFEVSTSLSFEDYFEINFFYAPEHSFDKRFTDRTRAAINRLAIRQYDEAFVNKPIRLFSMEGKTEKSFQKFLSLEPEDNIVFNDIQPSFDDLNKRNKLLEKHYANFPKIVLYDIELSNQVGVANLKKYFSSSIGQHLIPSNMEFTIDRVKIWNYNGIETAFIQMHDVRTSKQQRILDIMKKL